MLLEIKAARDPFRARAARGVASVGRLALAACSRAARDRVALGALARFVFVHHFLIALAFAEAGLLLLVFRLLAGRSVAVMVVCGWALQLMR